MPDAPFRAIAESTYDWETWIDEHRRVRWTNAAVERLTGFTAATCIAMPDFPLALVHPDDRAHIAVVLARGAAGEAGNDIEFRILHRDGSTRWGAISFAPLAATNGVVRGFRTSVRDIDARKEAETRRRAAERRANAAARAQAELLAALSHELRSPLQCITGFGELMARHALSPELARYVTIITEQSSAALRLVEDLLHFASLAESHATLRAVPFDLAELARREGLATRPRLHPSVALEVSVEADATGLWSGDPDRVRQMVANLLANAARFTERGRIDLHVAHETGSGSVSISVRDTGPGMSASVLARAKEPFTQGDPAAASRGGVGLGLAIVDRLANAMGGTLVLASVEGEGTTARIVLPLARADVGSHAEAARAGIDAAAASHHHPREEFGHVRVLVVDDSEPGRELLATMFATLGAAPDQAPSGEAAIELARANAYDLIVLDYHMPRLDGVATAARLRANLPPDAHPLVVLLTANVLAEAFDDPVGHGLDAVLAKPLRLVQVEALLARALEAGAGVDPTAFARPVAEPGDDGIDRAVVRDLVATRAPDGSTLLARTLARTIPHVAHVLGSVREALGDASFEPTTIADAIHGLDGLVASLGAGGAARLAAEAVRAAREGAPAEELRVRLATFEAAFAEQARTLRELSGADIRD